MKFTKGGVGIDFLQTKNENSNKIIFHITNK